MDHRSKAPRSGTSSPRVIASRAGKEQHVDARENMIRAVEFRRPERLPLRFPSMGLDDTHSVRWNQIGTGDHGYRQTYDEWGCLWVRSETRNMGQVKGHPLARGDAPAS